MTATGWPPVIAIAVLASTACADRPPADFDASQAEVTVRDHLVSLAEAMEARDAERVMAHYLPDSIFLVTVDGMVYDTFDSLRADVRRGHGMLEEVEMEWGELDIALLSPDVAAVTGPFEQRTMLSDGTPWNTSGIWIGTLIRSDGGWRIVRSHQQTFP